MASKTIEVSEEAYNRLRSLKREGESFSEVINRLTGKYSLLDLSGVLDEDTVQETRDRINALRDRMRTDVGKSRRSQ